MGYYSFSKTFQKFQLKDNKFHVLFHTKFLDVDYLSGPGDLFTFNLFKHSKTSDSLKMTGVLDCFKGFFYPNLVQQRVRSCIFWRKSLQMQLLCPHLYLLWTAHKFHLEPLCLLSVV